MRAQEASTLKTQLISFFNELIGAEKVTSITSVTTTPPVTVNNQVITGAEDGVTFDFTGVAPLNYLVEATVGTDNARTLVKSVWVRVFQPGELAFYPSVVDVLHRFRVAVADSAKNTGLPSVGFSYIWEEFDQALLWTNVDIINYFRETLLRFGRQRGIRDNNHTPAMTQLSVVASQTEYGLSPFLITIDNDPIMRSNKLPVRRKSRDYLSRNVPGWEEWSSEEGQASWYIKEDSTFTLVPIPAAVDTLDMTISRYPLDINIQWEDRDTYFIEPGPAWVEAIVHGMKYLAYSKRETDANRPKAASFELSMFNTFVGPEVSAQTLKDREFFTNHDLEIISY